MALTHPGIPSGNAPTRLPTGATVQPEPGTPAFYGQAPGVTQQITPDSNREYVVRMVNEGTSDFRQRYLTNIYTIPAKAEMIVPWEVMVAFCGNPYVVNTAKNPEREDVWRRLRVRYGLYDNVDDWAALRPQIACYSVTTGERLATVMDDPTGVGLLPTNRTIADDTAMQQQIAALTAQLQALNAQVMQQSGAQIVPTPIAPPEARLAADGLPVDDETTIPVTTSGTGQSAPLITLPETPGQRVFDQPPANSVPIPTSDSAVEDGPSRPKITSR